MKAFIQPATIVFLLAILSSCSSTKVVSDIDSTVDFTKIKTFEYYGWAKESDKALNQFDRERIEQAFAEEGRKRGLTRVDSDGDAIVSLFVTGKVKTTQTATTTGMGMGGMGGMGRRGMGSPGWGWGGGHSTTHITESQYLEGTLMIERFDPDTKKLIWQGIGTGTVDDNPQSNEEGIPKAVAAIMKQFPIAAN